jgi:hypothetical protein
LDWSEKVKRALPNVPARVSFTTTAKGNIAFSAELSDKELVYAIVEFDKN